MKKIIAVSIVRNENDVIESFSRYILSYCDRLIIHDDRSSDNTKSILRALQADGYPITFSEEIISTQYSEFRIPQMIMTNTLISLAFDLFDADVIVIADADEFLMCSDGSSPRTILEHLDGNKEYRAKWRTYLCDNSLTQNHRFLPDYFTSHRHPALERFSKVFFTRDLYYDFDCKTTQGNHMLIYPNEGKTATVHALDNLFVAHYPVRSISQIMVKIVNGWHSYLASPSRVIGSGFHWEKIYHRILATETLDASTVRDISFHYGLEEGRIFDSELLTPVMNPLKSDFAHDNLLLKYTNYSLQQDHIWSQILENTEQLIRFLVNQQIQASDAAMNAKNELESMRHSRSWRITKPLRSLFKFFCGSTRVESD